MLDGDIGCMDAILRGENHPVVEAMQVVVLGLNIVGDRRHALRQERSMPSWLYHASGHLPFKTWKAIVGSSAVMLDVSSRWTI